MIENKSRVERKSLSEETQRNFYIGHKFEMLCTLSQEDYKCRNSFSREELAGRIMAEPVLESEQFGIVAKSRLGAFRIYIGAEVDAIEPPIPDSSVPAVDYLDKFVEIKTHCSNSIEDFDPANLKWKGLKIWAQSYLIGISKIYMGFRKSDGDYLGAQMLPLSAFIPAINNAKSQKFYWEPSVTLRFAENILKEFTRVAQRAPNQTWLVTLDPSCGMADFELQSSDESSFLPGFWYQFLREGEKKYTYAHDNEIVNSNL